jgi:hypothetical protein
MYTTRISDSEQTALGQMDINCFFNHFYRYDYHRLNAFLVSREGGETEQAKDCIQQAMEPLLKNIQALTFRWDDKVEQCPELRSFKEKYIALRKARDAEAESGNATVFTYVATIALRAFAKATKRHQMDMDRLHDPLQPSYDEMEYELPLDQRLVHAQVLKFFRTLKTREIALLQSLMHGADRKKQEPSNSSLRNKLLRLRKKIKNFQKEHKHIPKTEIAKSIYICICLGGVFD